MTKWKWTFCVTKLDILDRIWGNSQNQERIQYYGYSKQEYLALVRDGSQKGKIRKGYWTLEILGADTDGDRVIPLYGELYSQRADGFQSENKQILGAIDLVRKVIGKKGIWTLDRGSDARNHL